MGKKFYTIDDLYEFCKENHFEKFSSAEKGAPLIIQSIGTFESCDNLSDGLLPVKLKSCHTGKNRNKSGISDDTMNLYKNSFQGRPILGAIYQTDTGEYEFRAHDMEIIEDDNGEVDVKYIEQPIGVISQTEEPYLEFDEKENKNFLMVSGTIFSDYSKAAEILERRRTCKCSVEIAVEEMSYNCSEDYLSIDKFHFCGVTILGYQQDGITEIQEGMAGSKITIDDFSAKQNSMFANNYQNKMIEVLEKLNTTLSNFNNSEQKGGEKIMNKFEELLAQYNVTAEDVTFETEGLSDEELEAKFAEVFGDSNEEDPINEGESAAIDDSEEDTEGKVGTDDGESKEDATSEDGNEPVATETEACGGKKKKKYNIDENGDTTISFEISHEDIRGALFQLIAVYEEEDNEWYWITNVYDDYFIFENWSGDKIYKQSYSVDGDNVSLEGDRQTMFKMILTESEKLAIDKMREDYAALEAEYNELKTFKDNYDTEVIKSQKNEIFAKSEYECLAENEAFNELIKDAEKYSVEEINTKADLIFAAHMKSTMNFSVVDEKKPHVIGISFDKKDAKKGPYGNLFPNK